MSVSIDLTDPAVTSDDLEQLRVDVINEQERRQRLDENPGQITWLVRQYLQAGGDPAAITAAIDEVIAAEQPG